MAIVQQIAVDLVARTENFAKAMQDTSARVKAVGEDLKTLGKDMSLFVTAPIVGGFIAASRAIDTQEEALAKLDGVLRATGGAAGVTSDHVRKLAASLQQTTTFGDEATIAGAAVLLTFKGIRNEAGEANDIFDRTLSVGMDLAALLEGDLQGSMIMLGKAIEDPVLGMSALKRVGVSFTQEQVNTVKALIETNRTLDAQKVVLAAVEGQVKGTAEALAQTVSGQITQASNNFGDQMERMGKAIEPFRITMAAAMQGAANQMGAMSDSSLALTGVLAATAAGIGPILMGLGQLTIVTSAFLNVQKSLNTTMRLTPWVLTATAIAAIAAAFAYAYGKSETFRDVVHKIGAGLVGLGRTILEGVMPIIKGLGDLFGFVFGHMVNSVTTAVTTIANLLSFVLPESVVTSVTAFKDNLSTGVRDAVDTAKQIISELRAPSLDLGVTGSNAAAVEALYGPIMAASAQVGESIEVDFGKATAALNKQTEAMGLTTIAHIPMQEAMRRDIELMQAEANVIIATTKSREEMWERINENRAAMVEQTAAQKLLTAATNTYREASDLAKGRLGALGGETLQLASRFTPLGLLMEVLGEAFEVLKPVVESLMEPFKIIGLVLGKALASVLKALFPIIKIVAIAFTYIGQIFFKIAELSAKSFGYLIKAIGKAIDKLPLISAKGVIRAGQALIDLGNGFGQAYKDLGKARDEIRGLELPEEKEKETNDLLEKSNEKQDEIAQNTERTANAIEEMADRPPIVINVTGTNAGTGGPSIGEQIAQQLDDYYGRSIVREERNLGRVGAF